MLTGIPDPQHPGKMMMGYAPASDNNDQLAYANAISKHTGLPITTRLADISDAKLETSAKFTLARSSDLRATVEYAS